MSFRRHAALIFPAGLSPLFCIAAMILVNVHWYYVVLVPHIPEGKYSIEVKVDPKWGRDYAADATVLTRYDDTFYPGYTAYKGKLYLAEITWASGRSRSVDGDAVQPGESVEIEEALILEDVMREYDSLYFDPNFDDTKRLDYLDDIIQDAYLSGLSDSAVAAYEEQTINIPILTPELLGITREDKLQSIGWWPVAEHILVFVCALFVFTPFTHLLPEWARDAERKKRLKEYEEREALKQKKD